MTRKLERHTERAIKEAAKLIPDIVFLAPEFRKAAARVQIITTEPPTRQENVYRIAEADPIGFLVACMNGQPMPEFKISGDKVDVIYHTPSLELRAVCARYLAMLSNGKGATGKTADGTEFSAMVKNAAKKRDMAD